MATFVATSAFPEIKTWEAHCFLKINGKSVVEGGCVVNLEETGGVALEFVGKNKQQSVWVTTLYNDNGAIDSDHGVAKWMNVHEIKSLGEVHQKESCWKNQRVEICYTSK